MVENAFVFHWNPEANTNASFNGNVQMQKNDHRRQEKLFYVLAIFVGMYVFLYSV